MHVFLKKNKITENVNIVETYAEDKNCPCTVYIINTCPETNKPC